MPRKRGDYHVLGEIARGGMGRILLAYDRDFRRRIAVKVLLGQVSDRARVGRFLEEAQLLWFTRSPRTMRLPLPVSCQSGRSRLSWHVTVCPTLP